MKRRTAIAFGMSCAAASVGAVALRPRHPAAESLTPVMLEEQVPVRFADWAVDRGQIPVLPNPEVQAKLDKIYTQVLARTYADPKGRRVMLSIAYGADQGSDATAVHRPEFCYAAQGFALKSLGVDEFALHDRRLHVRRLIASIGQRVEPISYWVTLNDAAVLPGVQRKLEQIRLGLTGQIPDGMLVRVSNLGADAQAGFALQQEFLEAMSSTLSPALRNRYFGKPQA